MGDYARGGNANMSPYFVHLVEISDIIRSGQDLGQMMRESGEPQGVVDELCGWFDTVRRRLAEHFLLFTRIVCESDSDSIVGGALRVG